MIRSNTDLIYLYARLCRLSKTLAFLILAAASFACVAAAQDSRWSGAYTFDEESLEPGGARKSYWFHLDVKEVEGKLVGIYSEGINGQAVSRFQLAVKTERGRAQFYYSRCLSRVEGGNGSCEESEFSAGELMFELAEQPRHCKTEIVTVWHKINLAAHTETGDGEEVFFRKVY